jgi:hypothetical protein
MDLEEDVWDVMNKFNSTQDRGRWWVLVNTVISFGFHKGGELTD